MSRPFFKWLLFAACLAVFLGAMLWISLRTLDLEAQRQRTAEEAQVQERLRLALWRMDSLASALLIRENARPPQQYQAFYSPTDLFASGGSNYQIPQGQALQPSPLLAALPDLVQLHFELVPNVPLASSPQAPSGSQGQLANQWYAITPQLETFSKRLAALGELLKRHPELRDQPRMTNAPLPFRKEDEKVSAAKDKEVQMNDLPNQQLLANSRELSQRSKIVTQNVTAEKAEIYNAPMKKVAPPAAKPQTSTSLDTVIDRYRGNQTLPPATPARQPLPTIAGDLRPTWVEGELMLLRRASLDGRDRVQGVWLDLPTLRERLLETVRDLLPAATLAPILSSAEQNDATALVTLPLKLMPGAVTIDTNGLASALKPALAIAWGCVLAAALAIAFVLHRAVLLSERRGAFVSSVTHELRTPLTTFRLYSEMLAEDMVPDAARRREYLNTLCDESTRLMHLVENVLAYSRIERGRTAARLETVAVGDLLQRILPRLRQRTQQVDLDLQNTCAGEVEGTMIHVDALAVEQILFNLVDNACKYAAPDSDPREIRLSVTAQARRVCFELRDFGPGLSRGARKKLFTPFAKSATEAAHSAPGVGLGLALCRRLARELGGDLVFSVPEGRGAAFRLTLDHA